ncbi:hypothetical protein PAXRUDRAFT_129278 [Paxillus rubicundulus Ve08.2h10]|uniref:HTH CENPB-type domain-containing protein n=1 Tax=Paxillus rubicundulus Ve08.2h10 TaxID=930991 RepID=A0A0D0DY83_9AGAM|nr:hypothetical protein PAXRUDRAFT_129278 [Paxillus rubicundulus Ve08.2h10]
MLKNCLEGGRSFQEANGENYGWLNPEEEENIVAFCIELATRGFPLSHETLKSHVDALLKACLKSGFPKNRVGKNWTDRFMVQHYKCLSTYWSSSLDAKCGQAVNENTHKAWCSLLRSMLNSDEHQIEEDCIWAADETGSWSWAKATCYRACKSEDAISAAQQE